AVLDRADVPGGERAAVAVAVDAEDDRAVDAAPAQEVAVERVRYPIRGHRLAGRSQRLRGDLPAVERVPAGLGPVRLAAKEVAVEHFEIEEGREILAAHVRSVCDTSRAGRYPAGRSAR